MSNDKDRYKYRIIIAGGRDFTNYSFLCQAMDILTENLPKHAIQVVCGEAKGADTLGKNWAIERGYSVKSFLADWSSGRSAGIQRNIAMGDYATHLVAFWNGISKGTKHMIDYAESKNLKVRVVNYV
jgi:hypothetical protein